jgi:hypothetical protein
LVIECDENGHRDRKPYNEKERMNYINNELNNFIDIIRIIWSIVPFLFNVIMSPITLFMNFAIPSVIGVMIGIPYMMILILAIFSFFRGSGD